MPDPQATVCRECQRCGAAVESDDTFCRQCGGRVGAASTGGRWRSALSWLFYLLLMLGTAWAVYAYLQTRHPLTRTPPRRPRAATEAATVSRLDAGEGDGAKPSSVSVSPTPKAAARSTRRLVKGGPSAKVQRGGAASPTVETRADARVERPEEGAPRVSLDAGPAKGKGAGSRAVSDGGRAAKTEVDSGLSAREAARARVNAGAIGYVVNHHRVRLRRCLERLTKKGLEPSGLVEIHLSVGADGRALHSKVHGNTTGYASLGRCIANEMVRWRYPRPAGGRAELIYPFRFTSGK